MSQRNVPEDRLYHDAELAQFYDLDNGWGDDLDYCRKLAGTAQSILDLGCGTGIFAATLAGERAACGGPVDITGVDPAAAMLDIARHRAGGDHVTWIEADARQLRLGRRFDLVLLTGHAFQVFLTETDRLAVLRTIAAHLKPTGRFIFDTRNPAMAEWRGWLPDQTRRRLYHPAFGTIEAWNDRSFDAETSIVTYETHYRRLDTGQVFSADSRIAFPGRDSLERLMAAAGLVAETWLSTWRGDPASGTAKEIIPIGRRNGL